MARFSDVLNIFGIGKREKPQGKREGQLPLPTLANIRGRELLAGTLEETIGKRGFGISPEALKAETAGFAAQQRAGLQERTLPAIRSAASAAGVGRSTIPVGQAGLASAGVERDIATQLGTREVQSEMLKAQQLQNALQQLEGFGLSEAQQQNIRRAAEGAEMERIQGLRGERDAATQEGLNKLLSLGSVVGGKILKIPQLGVSIANVISGNTKSATSEILEAIIKAGSAETVTKA